MTTERTDRPTTVLLTRKTHEMLRRVAYWERSSVGGVIRKALAEFLGRRKEGTRRERIG